MSTRRTTIARLRKALELTVSETSRGSYRVVGGKRKRGYRVIMDSEVPVCSCPDYTNREVMCKHADAVLIYRAGPEARVIIEMEVA